MLPPPDTTDDATGDEASGAIQDVFQDATQAWPQLPLRHATPVAWVALVEADFDRFLLDHAACERKAAALCMSLVARFGDYPALVDPLVSLAREELEHFALVHRLLVRRGVAPAADEKDPYVNGLLAAVRHGRDGHLLDRLLVAALVEARSSERFSLLAEHVRDATLRTFYAQLTRSEAGHYRVFVRLAERYYDKTVVAERLDELLTLEAEVARATPLRPTMH
jgi:tRNA-(ms[2]io[6]A)-hydroxylase